MFTLQYIYIYILKNPQKVFKLVIKKKIFLLNLLRFFKEYILN